MPARIAIALGDVTGVGPEVTLKALANLHPSSPQTFVIIGDSSLLRSRQKILGVQLELRPYSGQSGPGVYTLDSEHPLPAGLPAGDPLASNAAVDWLREGARRALTGEFQALITAPVSKEAIIRAGHTSFIGQTEFLSELAGTPETIMMLLGHDDRQRWLRVALATTHVPIKDLAAQLTSPKVLLAIQKAAQACRDLRLTRARIGVCGLNPHAGEGGKMGMEEITTIAPAVQQARAQGLDVEGPLSADTLFHHVYRGDYDAVVAMYHDQGLAPLKMIAFDSGVNWTLGLPFIRTSPDHGTAYNIAGQGKADPSSMTAAFRLAIRLADPRP